MSARTVRGFDYHTHQSIALSRREVRRIIVNARDANLLRRAAGDFLVMHWTRAGLRIAAEYYLEDNAQQSIPTPRGTTP